MVWRDQAAQRLMKNYGLERNSQKAFTSTVMDVNKIKCGLIPPLIYICIYIYIYIYMIPARGPQTVFFGSLGGQAKAA